jgi:tetratricopeptide (TPR) repeat protein
MGVFAGGCDLEAAEIVCGQPDDSGLGTAQALAELIAASLVVPAEQASGELRYEMLETVREYAAERLAAAPDRIASQTLHADHFLRLAEAGDAELGGPRMAAWLARLNTEHANLRVALDFFTERPAAQSGLRLAGALWRFWLVQGHLSEGRRRLERLLTDGDLASSGDPGWPTLPALARALVGAGALAWRQQDVATARARLVQAVDVSRAVGERVQLATALKHLGLIALKAEPAEVIEAQGLFEESLALRRALHDEDGTASCLNDLAVLALDRADYPRATELLTESLSICRASGNPYGPSFVLNNLSLVALAEADYARARGWLRESLSLARPLGSQEGISCGLCGLASLAAAQGEATTAARLFGAAEALRLHWVSPCRRPSAQRTAVTRFWRTPNSARKHGSPPRRPVDPPRSTSCSTSPLPSSAECKPDHCAKPAPALLWARSRQPMAFGRMALRGEVKGYVAPS